MNSYIERSKSVILDYLSKAQRTDAKIAEGRRIYQPDSMEQEEKRLRGELMKARKETEAKLDSIYQEASEKAREWGTLDGSKLSDDVRLLQGQGVTPEQFNQLVTKYQDNYTMLDQLKKYGEAKNKEAEKEAREAGNREIVVPDLYDVRGIPDPDSKLREWDDMRARATYFLNVADGTGFKSDFEKVFATNTAQKTFDAWGEDAPVQQESEEDTVNAFIDAWGFEKK